MERDKKREALDLKRPRMLDLDTPLLSTRRLCVSATRNVPCSNSQDTLRYACDRIPFSWEQAPGRPKNLQRCVGVGQQRETPSLKYPPNRRHSRTEATNDDVLGSRDEYTSHGRDDGCDGDAEDGFFNGDDERGDAFSDAMDMFSLSEAIDYVEKASKTQKLDRVKLKSLELGDDESANFMMQRFLPDATALAESSTLSNHLNKNSYFFNYPKRCVSRSISESSASTKRCGPETIFRWHIKNRLCGVRSPATSVQIRCHVRRKKHNSSVERTFACPSNDI